MGGLGTTGFLAIVLLQPAIGIDCCTNVRTFTVVAR
jgi:hypothetical protein